MCLLRKPKADRSPVLVSIFTTEERIQKKRRASWAFVPRLWNFPKSETQNLPVLSDLLLKLVQLHQSATNTCQYVGRKNKRWTMWITPAAYRELIIRVKLSHRWEGFRTRLQRNKMWRLTAAWNKLLKLCTLNSPSLRSINTETWNWQHVVKCHKQLNNLNGASSHFVFQLLSFCSWHV